MSTMEQYTGNDAITGSVKDKIGAFERIGSRRYTLIPPSTHGKNNFQTRRNSYVNGYQPNTFQSNHKNEGPFLLPKSFDQSGSSAINNYKLGYLSDTKSSAPTIYRTPSPGLAVASTSRRSSTFNTQSQKDSNKLDKDINELNHQKEIIEEKLRSLSSQHHINEKFKLINLSSYQLSKIGRMMLEYTYIVKLDESLKYQKQRTNHQTNSTFILDLENDIAKEKLFEVENQIEAIQQEKREFETKKARIISFVVDPDESLLYQQLIDECIVDIEFLCKEYARLFKDIYIQKKSKFSIL